MHVSADSVGDSGVTNGSTIQGGGPASVSADIDGRPLPITPDHRYRIPRDTFPRFYDWKGGLADTGFDFNIEYLSLHQWTNSDRGAGNAAAGFLRFYGTWSPARFGQLTFKVENRHAYTDVAPQDLGFDAGALSLTGTLFSDAGTLLTNFFWSQNNRSNRLGFRAGLVDVTDYIDSYGLMSVYDAFQNGVFTTNATINAPGQGLGAAGGARLGEGGLVIFSIADQNGDPSDLNFDVFSDREFFTSLDLAWAPDYDKIFYSNIHTTIWHSDESADGTREEDYGATLSISWYINDKWLPFLRMGLSNGKAALYEKLVSTGVGYYRTNGDQAGIGINWVNARDLPGDQYTAEAYYRFSFSKQLELTPSVQYIRNPLLDPSQNGFGVLSLRFRIIL